MQTTHKLVLATLFASVLAACGGGGGGAASPSDSAPAGAPLAQGGGDTATPPPPMAGGTAAPAPSAGGTAGSPSPTAAAFQAFEPVRVAENPVSSSRGAVARLAGGGNVALWTAHGSSTRDSRLMAQLTDAAGNLVGAPFVVQEEVDAVTKIAVAPTADGGFLVVWSGYDGLAMTPAAVVQNLLVRRYSADGMALDTMRVAQSTYYDVQDISVTPAGNGFIVGWSASVARTAPYWGHLQRLGPAGEVAGDAVDLQLGSSGVTQWQVAIAPLPDGTVSAVWVQDGFGNTSDPYSIVTRRFDANLQPLAGPTVLAGTGQAALLRMSAAALGANIGIAWVATAANGSQEVRTTVIAPEASSVGTVAATPVRYTTVDLRVLPLAPGEFGVAWQDVEVYPRGTNATLYLQRHDTAMTAHAAPVALNGRAVAWVSDISGRSVVANTSFDIAGGADGHVVATYQAADATQPNQYLFGR